ncbi:hypothetical protein QYF36_005109 [Acer negundo]|nr:hypothetical protein QYF36_005109 [Acer negundo]
MGVDAVSERLRIQVAFLQTRYHRIIDGISLHNRVQKNADLVSCFVPTVGGILRSWHFRHSTNSIPATVSFQYKMRKEGNNTTTRYVETDKIYD